ncbi:hypothetical protein [Allopontixanthobacter sediminis]|uniref:Uncharacterized protein n=1 Tax=Allopontixanthobacter sediminis TaxID=1689985 RepID=A0A845B0B5_9SPHN|nr:hypothetical protein [Allopontixanthobacter sediminis]MXP44731.1 hypothetical protein [Allopontixanthobacter sediminis]
MATSSPGGAMHGRNIPAWREPFLAALAESSNIAGSARAAKVNKSTIYKHRRENADFRSAWFDALCEGYDNLEMSLLYRLRIGELEGTKTKARRKFDNATAFRLLAAHRESVSQRKALRDDEGEDAILASINTKLDAMRAREKAVQILIAQDSASSTAMCPASETENGADDAH